MKEKGWLAVICGLLLLVLGVWIGRWSVLSGGTLLRGSGGESALPQLELSRPAETQPTEGRLDLNAASTAELMELPGVGTVLAGRIVAAREARGGFTQVSQLLEIEGIGESLYGKLRELVFLPEETP